MGKLLLDAIHNLPEERQKHGVPSSFSSLFKTVLHMLDAESIWWQRMKLQERIVIPSESFNGDTKELSNALLNQNRQWHEWVMNANELLLAAVFLIQM